jgi:hypothetical protein
MGSNSIHPPHCTILTSIYHNIHCYVTLLAFFLLLLALLLLLEAEKSLQFPTLLFPTRPSMLVELRCLPFLFQGIIYLLPFPLFVIPFPFLHLPSFLFNLGKDPHHLPILDNF